MICVNLFLFPWRKEIRSLKTFTGPFVYFIQPVLPQDVITKVLEWIGYKPETETEYRLSKDNDYTRAKQIGFELFLARQECECMLEAMADMKDSECLEVLQKRSPELGGYTERSESLKDGSQQGKLALLMEEQAPVESVFPPETALTQGDQVSFETVSAFEDSDKVPQKAELTSPLLVLDQSKADRSTEVKSTVSTSIGDDNSITDIYAAYPDLAIGQKPIFREAQKLKISAHDGNSSENPRKPDLAMEASQADFNRIDDQSGSLAITMFSDSEFQYSNEKEAGAETAASPTYFKDPKGSGLFHSSYKEVHCKAVSEKQSNVDEFASMLTNMRIKECNEEDLKHPIEETSQHENSAFSESVFINVKHPGSPKDLTRQIVCNPSPVLICQLPDYRSRVELVSNGRQTFSNADALGRITEPPQSFYIPPKSLENQHPIEDSADCNSNNFFQSECNYGENCHPPLVTREPQQPDHDDSYTFTGPFVYFIQPVLPQDVITKVLEWIGYKPETETEYRLSKDNDYTRAKQIGFELFLARQECECMLEAMADMKDSECLEVLQKRSPELGGYTERSESLKDGSQQGKLALLMEEQAPVESVFPPETALTQGDQVSFETVSAFEDSDKVPQKAELTSPLLVLDQSKADRSTEVKSTVSTSIGDDNSITDIYAAYPDLAIGQKPIFREAQKLKISAHDGNSSENPRKPDLAMEASQADFNRIDDQSGSLAITMFSDSEFQYSNEKEAGAETAASPTYFKDPKGSGLFHSSYKEVHCKAVSEKQSNVDEFASMLTNMRIKECNEEDLKHPIEETSQHENSAFSESVFINVKHPGSPKDLTRQIVCNPSPVLICQLPDYRSRVELVSNGRQTFSNADALGRITEPPQSFYIPPKSLENQHPIEDSADCNSNNFFQSECNYGENCHPPLVTREPQQPDHDDSYVFL
ncbi:SPAT2 protein, partial [Polyodon spathula]|nr:SPAT2 protein [Polyodon spathula]